MAKNHSELNVWHWQQIIDRLSLLNKHSSSWTPTESRNPRLQLLMWKAAYQKNKKAINNRQQLRFALHARRTHVWRHSLLSEPHFVHFSWCSHCRHLWRNCGSRTSSRIRMESKRAVTVRETKSFVVCDTIVERVFSTFGMIVAIVTKRLFPCVTITVWSSYWTPVK
jgi:hypothetical protein